MEEHLLQMDRRAFSSLQTSLAVLARRFYIFYFHENNISVSRLSVSNSRISKEVGLVDQHRIEWGRVDYLEVNYLSKLQNFELFFAELNLRNTNFWIIWRVN